MSSPAASVLIEPFDAYLRRRARSTTVLTPGEAVTATVGLLRGCRRAAGRLGGVSWWLTAEGRPVPIEDAEAPDAVEATAETLARLGALSPDDETREIVRKARESMLTRPPREWDALERRLFSHAAPVALTLGPLVPAEPEIVTAEPSVGTSLSGLVDADLAEAVRAAVGDLHARWRGSPRWRAITVGVAVAAVIAVAAAVLLPGREHDAPHLAVSATPDRSIPQGPPDAIEAAPRSVPPDSARARRASPDPAATAVQHAIETPGPAATSPAPVDERIPLSDDAVETARRLFEQIERCAGDPVCTSSHEEGSTFIREPLLADAAAAEIRLLDDFGGVVVVRVGDAATGQYVTLARQNDRWLVRAVRTIADQPS
ncbi:hypothetical protein [Microbacterium sp.]|uniref:hypothetical protein n=1 Tax=Microbacterium sp. TaxID=51671 RepID=UPI00391C6B4F